MATLVSVFIAMTMPLCLSMIIVEVASLVAAVLPLVALFQIFDGANSVSGAIMRACGNQVCYFLHFRYLHLG